MYDGYGPPLFGSGLNDNDFTNETHKIKQQHAANARLVNEAMGRRKKGIHKLMQSGTPFGKAVKFLYRLIWNISYK